MWRGKKRYEDQAPLSQYCWVDLQGGSQLHQPGPEKEVTISAELYAEWKDAYLAFAGAFDTPIHRQKLSDEYSTDARDRLSAFNVKMITLMQESQKCTD
jgi:hypothetical protein